jgi:hypothetical protein
MHQFESDAKKLKTKAESRTTAKVVSLEVGGIYELK